MTTTLPPVLWTWLLFRGKCLTHLSLAETCPIRVQQTLVLVSAPRWATLAIEQTFCFVLLKWGNQTYTINKWMYVGRYKTCYLTSEELGQRPVKPEAGKLTVALTARSCMPHLLILWKLQIIHLSTGDGHSQKQPTGGLSGHVKLRLTLRVMWSISC